MEDVTEDELEEAVNLCRLKDEYSPVYPTTFGSGDRSLRDESERCWPQVNGPPLIQCGCVHGRGLVDDQFERVQQKAWLFALPDVPPTAGARTAAGDI